MLMDGAGVSGVIAMAQDRSPITERKTVTPVVLSCELVASLQPLHDRSTLSPAAAIRTPAGPELYRHSGRDERPATISSNTGTGEPAALNPTPTHRPTCEHPEDAIGISPSCLNPPSTHGTIQGAFVYTWAGVFTLCRQE